MTSVRYEQQRPGAQQVNYACVIAIPSLSLSSPYYSAVSVGRSAARAPNRYSVQDGCLLYDYSDFSLLLYQRGHVRVQLPVGSHDKLGWLRIFGWNGMTAQ